MIRIGCSAQLSAGSSADATSLSTRTSRPKPNATAEAARVCGPRWATIGSPARSKSPSLPAAPSDVDGVEIDRAGEQPSPTCKMSRTARAEMAPDDLTPTEEQVAALAGTGRTNREIARGLFMSPKTVEANLTRIYGKLGIRSRAELGARMLERRATEAAKK